MGGVAFDPSLGYAEAKQIQARLAALGDMDTLTLATLPDPALTPRATVWVTDLFGMPGGGRVVSEGGFWKPIRPLAMSAVPIATLTTVPLSTPTTLVLTGSSVAAQNVTLGMGAAFARPFPGYRQRIHRKATGLGALLVNTVGLTLNSWVDFEFDGSAWVQTAGGGLL